MGFKTTFMAVLILAAALAVILWPREEATQLANVVDRADSQSSGHDKSPPAIGADRVEAPEVSPPGISVVDATTRHPIIGARFHASTSGVVDTLPVDDDVSVMSNDSGQVPLKSIAGCSEWIVYATGYCACVLRDPTPGTIVSMIRATELRVDAIGEDGNPVAGVQLQLRCKGSPAVLNGVDCRVGIGDPRSATPAWVATTDSRGQAVFDTVPAGAFFLQALHPSCYAHNPEGNAGRPITSPGSVTLEMRDLFAVCAIPPPGRQVLSYAWSTSSRVDVGPGVMKGRVFARRALQRRWPDAMVSVSRPMDSWIGNPLPLICRAVLDGGVAAEATWPLERIRNIGNPVVLEVVDGVVLRDVRIRVLDAGGQPLAMNLLLIRDMPGEDPMIQAVRTGESVMLVPGTYAIKPEAMPLWLKRHFGDRKLVVRPTDPLEVRRDIVLDEAMRLVTIVPEVAPGAMAPGSVVHFLVDCTTGGSSYGVMNWEPAKGPIELLLPPGPVRIDVQGMIHQTNVASFEVVPGIGSQEIAMTLQRGSGKLDEERIDRHRIR